MKIWLMRHPPVHIPEGQCYGQTDVPLAAGYEDLVENARAQLPPIEALRVYSSDLIRCRLAAEHLSERVTYDERLRELHFGKWEGAFWPEIPKTEIDAWSADLADANPYEGESCNDLLARVRDFWEELIPTGQDSLIVSHAGWIRLCLAHLLEAPIPKAFRISIKYCGLTSITQKESWTEVTYINR
jgi:alpha-ribazole phosphatase